MMLGMQLGQAHFASMSQPGGARVKPNIQARAESSGPVPGHNSDGTPDVPGKSGSDPKPGGPTYTPPAPGDDTRGVTYPNGPKPAPAGNPTAAYPYVGYYEGNPADPNTFLSPNPYRTGASGGGAAPAAAPASGPTASLGPATGTAAASGQTRRTAPILGTILTSPIGVVSNPSGGSKTILGG